MDNVDCTTCRGRGELAVLGTFGITISPEDLETVECYACGGSGEQTTEPPQYVLVDRDGDWAISEPTYGEPDDAKWDYLWWNDKLGPREEIRHHTPFGLIAVLGIE